MNVMDETCRGRGEARRRPLNSGVGENSIAYLYEYQLRTESHRARGGKGGGAVMSCLSRKGSGKGGLYCRL